MKASKRCVICGNAQAEMLYLPLGIVKCNSCGLIYRDAAFDFEDHYQDMEVYKKYLEDKVKLAFRKRNAVHRFNLIESVTSRKGKFLDIGTNEGLTLLEAKERGFETVGCEPNVYASSYGKSKGLDIINSSFEKAFEVLVQKAPFDLISLFHVLEHFPDPNKPLQLLGKLLHPDSYLIIEVPDINSPASRIYKWDDLRITKEHLFYFTESTLRKLLENNGLEVVFRKKISGDEYNRSLLNNLIRLPLFMQLYMTARKLKSFAKRIIGKNPPARRTLDDNTELWIKGEMIEKKYILSGLLGKLIFHLERGDDLFIIARKNEAD